MALGAALVDRARTVSKSGSRRVEGTTRLRETRSPWFKARIMLAEAPESLEQDDRRRALSRPGLMYARLDENGDPVEVRNTMQVEVVSSALEDPLIYDVAGDPKPIRKKKRVIGWRVSLSRTAEHEFVDVTP